MTTYYIDTTEQLDTLCQQLQGVDWIAVDTEFLREKTYRPILCLIQIGTPELSACIDPLALENIDPLLDILYNPRITKVLHAAGQDLEIFYYLRGTLPSPIFDTQLAAPLLGYAEQTGYGTLVAEELGVELEKGFARTDWSRRPLSQQQLAYAADDVIYLAKLYPQIYHKLISAKRLDWLEEEFAALGDPSRYVKDPAMTWIKVRGIERLNNAGLSIVQALTKWRETTAQTQNIPRNWLLKDDLITDLARQKPKDKNALSRMRGLNDKLINRHGSEILSLIQQAITQKPIPIPPFKRKVKRTANQEALLDVLTGVLKLCAHQHQINPALVASRKQLEKLIDGEDSPLQHGWRKKLAGETLQNVLDGTVEIAIHQNEVLLKN